MRRHIAWSRGRSRDDGRGWRRLLLRSGRCGRCGRCTEQRESFEPWEWWLENCSRFHEEWEVALCSQLVFEELDLLCPRHAMNNLHYVRNALNQVRTCETNLHVNVRRILCVEPDITKLRRLAMGQNGTMVDGKYLHN
jgi:hypothetical protein